MTGPLLLLFSITLVYLVHTRAERRRLRRARRIAKLRRIGVRRLK